MASVKVSPSILSADFGAFGDDMLKLVAGGADYIHIDVMDGHYVPNISFGPELVKALRRRTQTLFDVHLMVEDPDRMIDTFADAGASMMTVHPETCQHLQRVLAKIRECGKMPGVALNPATPIEQIKWVLPDVDRVLIMTVNPGFGGQSFLHGMLRKVTELRLLAERMGLDFEIGVDGGVNEETAGLLSAAGADVLISGSAVFSHKDGPAVAMAEIRAAANSAASHS